MADEVVTDAFSLGSEVEAQIRSFDADADSYSIGDTVSVSVTVANAVEDSHTLFINQTLVGPDGNEYRPGGQTVTIDGSTERTITLTWSLPEDAPAGQYDGVVSVWAGPDSERPPTKLDSATSIGLFEVERPATADIGAVSVDKDRYSVGQSVVVSATIENPTESEQTVYVGGTITGPDGGTYADPRETGQRVTLSGGSTETIDLSWTVPSEAPAGKYTIETVVWAATSEDPRETQLDTANSGFSIATPDITVASIDVSSADEAPNAGDNEDSYEVGETLSITTELDNGGSEFQDTRLVVLIDTDGDDRADETITSEPRSLAPNEREGFDLTYALQSDGIHRVKVRVETRVDGAWTVTEKTGWRERFDSKQQTEDSPDQKPKARVVGISQAAKSINRGQSIQLTVTVENTGEVPNSFAIDHYVRDEDGQRYEHGDADRLVRLAPGERQSVTISWHPDGNLPVGTYDTIVTVYYGTDVGAIACPSTTTFGGSPPGFSGRRPCARRPPPRSSSRSGSGSARSTTSCRSGSTSP